VPSLISNKDSKIHQVEPEKPKPEEKVIEKK
jgi:hypothetical protein